MNSPTKVGEIFTAAGQAFSRLGDLTMSLQPNGDSPSGKWTDDEIDMLHASIVRFSDDLNKISLSIKNRTVSQIRQSLKKKAFEEAGIPAKQVPVQQLQQVIQAPAQQVPQQQQQQQQTQQPHLQLIKQQQQHVTTIQHQKQPQLVPSNNNSGTSNNNSVNSAAGQHQTVHIQHVQHILPLQHSSQQILQTTPKQIILQQTHANSAVGNSVATALVTATQPQQTQPQIVHLQPQQFLQQVQQVPQTTTATTTVTLAQFQQMQQQQKTMLAASVAPPALVELSPGINTVTLVGDMATTTTAGDTLMEQQQQHHHLQQQQESHQPMDSTPPPAQLVMAVDTSASAVVVEDNGIATQSLTSTTPTSTAALSCGPDVMMTLNRLNVQEHDEADVEQCLPADVVKLDFVSEQVTG